MWNITDITPNDRIEILDCLHEIMRSIDGDEEACDAMCYNPDYTDLWLCFTAGPYAVKVDLTNKADEAGFAQGTVYAQALLDYDYVKALLNEEE